VGGQDVKGIFDTKANSGYDDEIVRRYHFPPQYRRVAEQLVGDWIIYREPQRSFPSIDPSNCPNER
jgi:putative restriction endonuclease